MRLEKLIETTQQANRKQIKRLLLSKQVTVDGKIEFNGSRNVDSLLHHIEIAGEQVVTHHHYFLLNKPRGAVTAHTDKNHPTVVQLVDYDHHFPDLFPVGRLDRDTTGLLLLTDNGQLGYELLQPQKKVSKLYEAVVNEKVTAADVAAFAAGILFDGGELCRPAQLEIVKIAGGYSTVRLTIQEGKFHQVKKMFLARGKKVVALKRLAMGDLMLPADLAAGDYRALTHDQLALFRDYFK